MRFKAKVSLLAILVTAIGIPLSANAAFDVFMKVDGILGESANIAHPQEIVLVSYSQNFGTKNCSRVIATKLVDRASPALMGAAVGNAAIPTVVISMHYIGIGHTDFFKATLGTVTIERVDLGGETGELREQVVLKPRTIRIEYRRQKADGSFDEPITTDMVCT